MLVLIKSLILVSGIIGLLMGIGLLVFPQQIRQFTAFMNRWYSTRQALRPLDTPISIERFYYRNHRVFGSILFAGALFSFLTLLLKASPSAIEDALSVPDYIAQAFYWFIVAGNFLAIFVAVTTFRRPSNLKFIEGISNTWVSLRPYGKTWESMNFKTDDYVLSDAKRFGIVFATAGAILIISYLTIP